MAELKQEVQIGWQVFQRRDAMSEYVTISGREIDLVRFDALCATCGRPFMGKATKGNWRNKNLARRCQRHRRPGVWVDNDEPPMPIENMPLWARPKPWIKKWQRQGQEDTEEGYKAKETSGAPVAKKRQRMWRARPISTNDVVGPPAGRCAHPTQAGSRLSESNVC